MNEISLVGWFHTIAGTLAIFIGIYLISKFKVISSKPNLGKIYLILTTITAATSLMIFNNGGFNLAHLLGVFALLGVFSGVYYLSIKNFLTSLSIFKPFVTQGQCSAI